jgi:hypothetical protein
MRIIDPHIHMVSRTTDDYERMALAGVVAVTEPAFWAGFDRSAAGFRDYFRLLTEVEPLRAARYGIDHYTWMCINPKEAEDVALSREVIAMIPEFADHPRCLGIGEIGLNKNTKNEILILEEHIDLAASRGDLILVHTPHLEDKHKGTNIITSVLANDSRIDPGKVLIDHCEEHTIRMALDRGFWAGLTIYPISKCTPQRAADLIEVYSAARITVNSSADWGHSDPLAVHKVALELRLRGHDDALLTQVFHDNPCTFLGQNPKWKIRPIG